MYGPGYKKYKWCFMENLIIFERHTICKHLDIRNISAAFWKVSLYKKGILYVRTWI